MASVLLDRASGRVLRSDGNTNWAVPPGSTIKPFTLQALLASGKVRATERVPCNSNLEIAGHNLACSHPPDLPPMDVSTAIAYSCNSFVANMARRFAPGELQRFLERAGFARLVAAPQQLLALGEAGIVATPTQMANAYRWLSAHAAPPILRGLQDAVEFGTAQLASKPGVKLAGKTGSSRTSEGLHVAWFAGFTSDRVIAVVTQGFSGGADAAPIARALL